MIPPHLKQTTMKKMNFDERKMKGEWAELYVIEHIKSNGRMLYTPDTKDKAHIIDMFVMNDVDKSLIGVEVKTQSIWKQKCGINVFTILQRHWDEYARFMTDYSMDLYIVIVDWESGFVYTSMFSALTKIAWELERNKTLSQYPKLIEPTARMNDREPKIMIPIERFQQAWEIPKEAHEKFNN